jgi:hypothetical protein
MPPRSEKQRRAMHAAAKGQSTIGIPKSVGREFVGPPKGGVSPKQSPKGRVPPTIQQAPSQPSNPQQLQQAMMEAMRRQK